MVCCGGGVVGDREERGEVVQKADIIHFSSALKIA